eukprot:12237753-Alexandrium_andersonii.AAC.1
MSAFWNRGLVMVGVRNPLDCSATSSLKSCWVGHSMIVPTMQPNRGFASFVGARAPACVHACVRARARRRACVRACVLACLRAC